MRFFQNIRNAFARFMYGRNGIDQLNHALLRIYFAFYFLQIVFVMLHLDIPTAICKYLTYALMILLLFRIFSKNLYKRRAENQKWMRFAAQIRNDYTNAKARHADKSHKYFTCKQCKTICRVPTGKGKIVITCPKCGAQIHAKT